MENLPFIHSYYDMRKHAARMWKFPHGGPSFVSKSLDTFPLQKVGSGNETRFPLAEGGVWE